MRTLWSVVLSLSINLILTGCKEGLKQMPEWGLRSIEYRENIQLKDTEYSRELKYLAKTSSNKYEFRFFYPNLRYHEFSFDRQDEIDQDIFRSLNGFRFELIESETNQKLKENFLQIGVKPFKFSINTNKPISIWIASKANLESGKEYIVRLTVPPKRATKQEYLNPVFVIGIGKDIYP